MIGIYRCDVVPAFPELAGKNAGASAVVLKTRMVLVAKCATMPEAERRLARILHSGETRMHQIAQLVGSSYRPVRS